MDIDPLPEPEVKKLLLARGKMVNDFLADYMETGPGIPPQLLQAMNYSLLAGGKRIRPVLCLTVGLACGLTMTKTLPFASAIELVHTYSLIHDDLPAMDNDDFRRGRPSCHKQFDEATAILAGDALLTDAFTLACQTKVKAENLVAAIQCLAEAAGSQGMVGGQMLDMEYTGKSDVTLEMVGEMQEKKTGAMLKGSCVCGALLAGASMERVDEFSGYGEALGRAFQIADDILDITEDSATLGKPAGSDERSGKNTYPCLAGLERSYKIAREEATRAIEFLVPGPEVSFLAGLAQFAISRRK